MRKKWFFIAPLAILGIIVFVILGGEIVMRLWNWLVPGLTGWHQITFWEALGLLVLCRILFGGHGIMGSSRSNMRRRMAEKWDRMTPEEREKARQRFGGRCGPFDAPGVQPEPKPPVG